MYFVRNFSYRVTFLTYSLKLKTQLYGFIFRGADSIQYNILTLLIYIDKSSIIVKLACPKNNDRSIFFLYWLAKNIIYRIFSLFQLIATDLMIRQRRRKSIFATLKQGDVIIDGQ